MGILCSSCSKTQRLRIKNFPEEKTIVFIGSKGSGKSSLIYYLKNGDMKKSFQQSQSVEQQAISFNDKLYDIKELQNFYDQIKTDAWVYIVDMSQTQDCNKMLDFIKKVENKIPILFYLNKKDLAPQDLTFDTSQLNQIKDKNFLIFQSNNKREGITEGFTWLHNQLNPKNEKENFKTSTLIKHYDYDYYFQLYILFQQLIFYSKQ